MHLRGEVFLGFGAILSFTSLILLIFVHVAQTSTTKVPRSIYMARMNVSGYEAALAQVLQNDIYNLTTPNGSLPLGEGLGIRQYYQFGLYSHCGYITSGNGICSNRTIAAKYQPFDVFNGDMSANLTVLTKNIFPEIGFTDSGYLGSTSKSAYWLILLGTICAGLALILGLVKHAYTFFASTVFSMLGSLFLLVGASIWTVIVNKSSTVNNLIIGQAGVPSPVGIEVTVGHGLYVLWAAFVLLIISIVPYMISCCTFRG